VGENEKATKAFNTLKRKYPKSAEAKNVDYYRAIGLLEMGKLEDAYEAFREMFTSGGNYTDKQILFAATKLFEAGEYGIALEGFDRVLSSSSEKAVVERAMLGKGKSLVELGKYDEAEKVLVEMQKQFKGSSSLKQVYEFLSTTFGNLGSKEPDEDKRFGLFNKSVKALKMWKKHIPEDNLGGRAMTDVQLGRIYELKMAAEKEFGTEELVKLARDDAVGTYQTLILLGEYRDALTRKAIEEAFFRCIPLMLKGGMAREAKESADQYLETFANGGKYLQEIRKMQNEAKIQSIMENRTAPTPQATR
jgi:tetratricopeptide (TPR) repeat protein